MKNILRYSFLSSTGIIILLLTLHFLSGSNKEHVKEFTSFQAFSTEINDSYGLGSQGISDKNYFDLIFSSTSDSLQAMELYQSLTDNKMRNVQLQLRGIFHVLSAEEEKYLGYTKQLGLLSSVYLINTSMVSKNNSTFFDKLIEQLAFRFMGEALSYKNGFYSNESITIQQYNELEKITQSRGIKLNSNYSESVNQFKTRQNIILPKLISYILVITFWSSSIVILFIWFRKKITKKQ